MKRRFKIIVAVLAVVIIAAAVAAGFITQNAVTPKTTNAIQTEVDAAFKTADYFIEAQVQTYAGTTPSAQKNKDAQADSASINITTTTLTANNFTDLMKRLPTTDLNTFYHFALEQTESGDYTSVYGFSQKQLQDEKVVTLIVKALKTREGVESKYYQITSNSIPEADDSNVTVTALSPVNEVEGTRQLADAVISEGVNIIVINTLSDTSASYVQNAGVLGQLDNFDKALDFSLQFATETFSETNQISVIGLGKEIQISYGAVDKGQSLESLTKTANDINIGGAFGLDVKVNDPAATPK